ncbi:MAG TPA: helix-turn-helix domain-containing protein [Thermoplasmata archaeon]|nr:helix-turn-helix domain-containing protein [Thermoplasmata archaeon]
MSPGFRSLMWYLLYGTRGGPNRLRLLEALDRSPSNAHQLAALLALDYRTVRHHLRLLEHHGAVVRPIGDAYATPYEISPAASAYLESVTREGVGARAAADLRPRGVPGRGAEGVR